jgi:hypothetical protein
MAKSEIGNELHDFTLPISLFTLHSSPALLPEPCESVVFDDGFVEAHQDRRFASK